jgi:hypothetical protein
MKLRKSAAKLLVGVALPLGAVLMGAGSASASSGTPNVCTATHHSATGVGANTSPGPYTNTCEPEHLANNGNGGGLAVGKPLAGTVGNADDKQPPGQFPDGTDNNNGYECDGNSGIARENPAHTSCSTVPPCDPKLDPKCEPDPICDPKA